MKNPKASLKEEFTNSGYSSDPKTKRICRVLHCGTMSNSSIHTSCVARGSMEVSWGSLRLVPLQVPALDELFGPTALFTLPVVRRIPLVRPIFEEDPLKVP